MVESLKNLLNIRKFYAQKKEDFQEEIDDNIRKKNNILLVSPTGSGKTSRYMIKSIDKYFSVFFEECLDDAKLPEGIRDKKNEILAYLSGNDTDFIKNDANYYEMLDSIINYLSVDSSAILNVAKPKIIITAPIVNLSEERYNDLKKLGAKVSIETGEKKIVDEDSDFLACTIEIYNNKYIRDENVILVVDEVHSGFDEKERKRTFLDVIGYSKAKSILACSATIGKLSNVLNFFKSISFRDDFSLEKSDKRLTELVYNFDRVIRDDEIENAYIIGFSKEKCISNANVIRRMRNISLSDKELDEIYKVARKYNVYNTELFDYVKNGIGLFFGDLLPKEKAFISELFNKRLIDVVCGTNAISMGVNFPIKNIIYSEFNYKHKGYLQISNMLFSQINGRAGRKQYYDTGYIWVRHFDDDDTNFENLHSEENMSLLKTFKEIYNDDCEDLKVTLDTLSVDYLGLLKGKDVEEEARQLTKLVVAMKAVNKGISYDEVDDAEQIYLACLRKVKLGVDKISNFDLYKDTVLESLYDKPEPKESDYEIFNDDVFVDELSSGKRNNLEKIREKAEVYSSIFKEKIGFAFKPEYDIRTNCRLFRDVLFGTSIKSLIKKYVKINNDAITFGRYNTRSLLLLRNYLYELPEELRSKYDLSEIDNEINKLDYSILNSNQYYINDVSEIDEKETQLYEYFYGSKTNGDSLDFGNLLTSRAPTRKKISMAGAGKQKGKRGR